MSLKLAKRLSVIIVTLIAVVFLNTLWTTIYWRRDFYIRFASTIKVFISCVRADLRLHAITEKEYVRSTVGGGEGVRDK